MRDKINLDDSSYNQGQQEFNQEEQVVVQNTTGKQVLVILLGTIVGMIILYATIALICQGGESSDSLNLDPNRPVEYCSYYGEANVYPKTHGLYSFGGECYLDGDGWVFEPYLEDIAPVGHHHHAK